MRKFILLFAVLFTGPVMAANSPSLRSAGELETLVGPIALYPDDLVAVVLPAAAYPLQLVQAERAVADGDRPAAEWDESVVAVMNYPEVLEFLNADLDWTYELGLAFINQETAVFDAIQAFRADALAAGNLQSDEYQTVSVDRGIIRIAQRDTQKIYIPYYEPREVIVRHVRPVYHYYPVARPVYYYPYPAGYAFSVGHFYGVGTYFSIGWQYRGLSLSFSNHAGHPYWGISYSPRHYYFKPRVRPRLQASHRHHYKPAYFKPMRHKYRAGQTRPVHRKAAHRVAYKQPLRYNQPVRQQAKRVAQRRDQRPEWKPRQQQRNGVAARRDQRPEWQPRQQRKAVAARQDQRPNWRPQQQRKPIAKRQERPQQKSAFKNEQRPARKAAANTRMTRAERNSPQQARPASRVEKRIDRANRQAQRRVNKRQVGGNRVRGQR